MKILSKLLALFVFVLIISCSKDDDPVNTATCQSTHFNEEYKDELDRVTAATNNYAMDPTTENCEAFKKAYLEYIDAIEDWEECAILHNQEQEWRQAVDDAKIAANDIMC